MQGKQFTVAFLTWQHQLSLTSVYKYPRSPGKKGKITPVDLQPKQKKTKNKKPTKQTPVQIFSTRCFNKCAELLTRVLE